MKDHKKGFAGFVFIIIFFVIAIAIGAGVYYSLQSPSSEKNNDNILNCNVVNISFPPNIQQQLKDNCIKNLSIQTDNLYLCEKIKTEDIRSECYYMFALKRKDITLCEKISQPRSIQKDSCRYFVTVAKHNLSLCDALPNERGNFGKDGCYAAIGEENKDYTTCKKIPDEDSRNNCIETVARMKGECEVISTQTGKDYCYLYQSNSIQVTTRDKRCDIYQEPRLTDLCGKVLHGEITLEAMCSKIADAKLKQECLTYNISLVHVTYNT